MKSLILGIDEAGRGPVIGDLVIGGVLVDAEGETQLHKLGVRDSKLLTPKQREQMKKEIKKIAVEHHTVSISAKEIDELRKRMSLNEIEAMKMAELIEKCKKKPVHILIDLPDPTAEGFLKRVRKYTHLDHKIKLTVEHKADENYPVVSAASIIAKTERDRKMRLLEKRAGVKLGNGYPHDPDAIAFLEKCKGKLPDFVRKSWITTQRIQDKKFQKKLEQWGGL